MKSIYLMLTVLLTFTLCNSVLPENVLAKSNKKEVTTATEKQTTNANKTSEIIAKNININTADKELLTQLPGIGPVTADAILRYRNSKGKFESINDLKNVKGVGDKTLAKLKPYLQEV